MDHLPCSSQPGAHRHWTVPYLCALPDGFQVDNLCDYPIDRGWVESTSRFDWVNCDGDELATRAQSWLYFALLSAFLGENSVPQNFLRLRTPGHDDTLFSSTSGLHHASNWKGKSKANASNTELLRSDDSLQTPYMVHSSALQDAIIRKLIQLLEQTPHSKAQQNQRRIEFQDAIHSCCLLMDHVELFDEIAAIRGGVLPIISLSIKVLIDLLQRAFHEYRRLSPNHFNNTITSKYVDGIWSSMKASGPSKTLSGVMLDRGWCPYHVQRFSSRFTCSTMCFLATLPSLGVTGPAHEQCSVDEGCLAEKVAQRSSKHTETCTANESNSACQDTTIPQFLLADILETNDVPLLSFSVDNNRPIVQMIGASSRAKLWNSDDLAIIKSFVDPYYVAISDTRSNFPERTNSLTSCCIKDLYDTITIPFHHPLLWIADLCFPAGNQDTRLRAKAGREIAAIYARADSTIVFDGKLQLLPYRNATSSEFTTHIEPLAELTCSTWAAQSRSFIAQAMTENLHVQFLYGPTRLYIPSPAIYGNSFAIEGNHLASRFANSNCVADFRDFFIHGIYPTIDRDKSWKRIFSRKGYKSFSLRNLESFVAAWNGLAGRTGSQAEILLVFATVLGINPEDIVRWRTTEHMELIFKTQEVLPISLLHSHPRDKLLPSEGAQGTGAVTYDTWIPSSIGSSILDLRHGIMHNTSSGLLIQPDVSNIHSTLFETVQIVGLILPFGTQLTQSSCVTTPTDRIWVELPDSMSTISTSDVTRRLCLVLSQRVLPRESAGKLAGIIQMAGFLQDGFCLEIISERNNWLITRYKCPISVRMAPRVAYLAGDNATCFAESEDILAQRCREQQAFLVEPGLSFKHVPGNRRSANRRAILYFVYVSLAMVPYILTWILCFPFAISLAAKHREESPNSGPDGSDIFGVIMIAVFRTVIAVFETQILSPWSKPDLKLWADELQDRFGTSWLPPLPRAVHLTLLYLGNVNPWISVGEMTFAGLLLMVNFDLPLYHTLSSKCQVGPLLLEGIIKLLIWPFVSHDPEDNGWKRVPFIILYLLKQSSHLSKWTWVREQRKRAPRRNIPVDSENMIRENHGDQESRAEFEDISTEEEVRRQQEAAERQRRNRKRRDDVIKRGAKFGRDSVEWTKKKLIPILMTPVVKLYQAMDTVSQASIQLGPGGSRRIQRNERDHLARASSSPFSRGEIPYRDDPDEVLDLLDLEGADLYED